LESLVGTVRAADFLRGLAGLSVIPQTLVRSDDWPLIAVRSTLYKAPAASRSSFLVKARYDIGFDVAPQELEMHLQRVEKMGHIIENYCLRLHDAAPAQPLYGCLTAEGNPPHELFQPNFPNGSCMCLSR